MIGIGCVRRFALLVGIASVVGALDGRALAGGRLYVDALAAPGGGGSSWERAFEHLQDALDVAELAAGISDAGSALADSLTKAADGLSGLLATWKISNSH